MTTEIQAGDYVEIIDTEWHGAKWCQSSIRMLIAPRLLQKGDIVQVEQVCCSYAYYLTGEHKSEGLPLDCIRKVAAPPVYDWKLILTDAAVLVIGLIPLVRWEKVMQIMLEPVARQALSYMVAGTCYLSLGTLAWMLLKSIGRGIGAWGERDRLIKAEENEQFVARLKADREEDARKTKQREEAQLEHDTAVAIAQMKEAISQVKPIIEETVRNTIKVMAINKPHAITSIVMPSFGRIITNGNNAVHPNGKRRLEEGDIIEITEEGEDHYYYRCREGIAHICKSNVGII